ncbi:MAG: T9SS type A sorting domain-containing protein [Candidatus Kapabacteria bacterium]|nr:T9SS type A sorting domain-containing protein [Ignavibacteriota bacterium]MCW5885113.1 T9SS type A sorting domain-containing protein [Candidatus Kapabacteria bacterium]
MSKISKFSTIICIILLSLILYYNESNANYDPTYCDEGDTTAWEGPITLIGMGLPPSVIGCADSNCIVTVKFYERNIPGWGYEFQVAEISFQNCDSACMVNPWKAAMWMIAVVRKNQMGLINNNDCYDQFTYKAATCWQHDIIFNSYIVCGGECCVGLYRICKRNGPSGDYLEFTQLQVTQRQTYNCTSPCNFIDCSSTMPSSFYGPNEMPNGDIGVFYPKMSIYESTPSKFIGIHPNPTNLKIEINLKLLSPGNYVISVYDINGSEHYKKEITIGSNHNLNLDINTSSYPNGMYSIIVTGTNGEVITGKFIKFR